MNCAIINVENSHNDVVNSDVESKAAIFLNILLDIFLAKK